MRPYQQPQDDVETLVKDHLGLVRKIAWHVYGRVHSSIEVEDLIQIGYVGLITSAKNTHPKKAHLLPDMLPCGYAARWLTICEKVQICAAPQF